MHTLLTTPERQQLRELALARAHILRRQAIHDFWAGIACALARACKAGQRRRAAQPAEVA